jgi:hypothetical protein
MPSMAPTGKTDASGGLAKPEETESATPGGLAEMLADVVTHGANQDWNPLMPPALPILPRTEPGGIVDLPGAPLPAPRADGEPRNA